MKIQPSNESSSFSDYKTVFVKTLLEEFQHRVQQSEMEDVMRFILSVSTEYKLHTMFTPVGLQAVNDTVFLNTKVRDFILSLSDRFFIEIASDDGNNQNLQSLIQMIVNGLDFYTKTNLTTYDSKLTGSFSSWCKIPEEVKFNIVINGLENILRHNNWLIVTTMIMMCYPDLYLAVEKIKPKV